MDRGSGACANHRRKATSDTSTLSLPDLFYFPLAVMFSRFHGNRDVPLVFCLHALRNKAGYNPPETKRGPTRNK